MAIKKNGKKDQEVNALKWRHLDRMTASCTGITTVIVTVQIGMLELLHACRFMSIISLSPQPRCCVHIPVIQLEKTTVTRESLLKFS